MMIWYKLLLSSLVALQIIGPSWVLAIQTSRSHCPRGFEEPGTYRGDTWGGDRHSGNEG